MDYRSIKWTIFTVLSSTAPAILFLIMAVMFIPAVFFIAGILYVIPKAFIPAHTSESLSFIVILGIHALVYAGLYYSLSVLLAKVITRIRSRVARNCIVAAFCFALLLLTQFQVYGSGGHSPVRWFSLAELFSDINKSYGTGAVEIVYGTAILLLCGTVLIRKLKKKSGRRFNS